MSRRNKARQRDMQINTGATDTVAVQDSFSNPLFRLGWGSQSPLEATEYPLTRMTDNYALLNSLYRTNWVVQNVVGLIVDDMLREWYKLKGNITPEAQAAMGKIERETRIRDRLNEGLRWGRLYGGAAGLILLKGQEKLEEPLDLDLIFPGSFQGLYILDRWMGITTTNGLVMESGEPVPEYYSITDADGNTVARVHHSRVIRFTGRDLPAIERQAEMYWGESEIEALYKEVVAHDNVSSNMAALTFQANINTMEVKGLEQLFSIGSSQAQRRFWQVMQAQSVLRSNFGTQLVEQGNKLSNTQYTFTGLQDVYESMCLNLCGASHYPMTKLFGRSPSGMNATGESDLKNYYDYVDSQREAKLRPALQKLLPVLAMSAWGLVPDDLDFTFPPLWTPTAKEVAEIAKTKSEAIVAGYQAGLMNVDTAQKELKKLENETGMYGSIMDDEIASNAGKSYQDATALRDPIAGIAFGEDRATAFEGAAQDAALVYDYPGQPREKNGQFAEGKMLTGSKEAGTLQSSKKVSGSGANRFQQGFSSQNLNAHWDGPHSHAKEYPELTKEEYAQRALELVQSPVSGSVDGYKNARGQVVRYDRATNDYVVGNPDLGIATMFKPSAGNRYFDRLKERDGVQDE